MDRWTNMTIPQWVNFMNSVQKNTQSNIKQQILYDFSPVWDHICKEISVKQTPLPTSK